MNEFINFNSYPVNVVIKKLLKDKTTKKNIIFATNEYANKISYIDEYTQITETLLNSFESSLIQPRVLKSIEEKSNRTRKKAEVFTPSWICNMMNNHCDEEWFGKPGIFNTEYEQDWEINTEPIPFANKKDWQKYVDSKRIEITCGEAPYVVSRYDTTTGELIPIERRIGMLDRKLRVVNENAKTEVEWLKWVFRAYQSVYGYEFQGDNLLIARINLLVTFVDYMQHRWNRVPTDKELNKITNIIVWNFWQMDGISGFVPYVKPKEEYKQLCIFDFVIEEKSDNESLINIECIIYDWRSNESITYNSIKENK